MPQLSENALTHSCQFVHQNRDGRLITPVPVGCGTHHDLSVAAGFDLERQVLQMRTRAHLLPVHPTFVNAVVKKRNSPQPVIFDKAAPAGQSLRRGCCRIR
jgi:hypothetical protein